MCDRQGVRVLSWQLIVVIGVDAGASDVYCVWNALLALGCCVVCDNTYVHQQLPPAVNACQVCYPTECSGEK